MLFSQTAMLFTQTEAQELEIKRALHEPSDRRGSALQQVLRAQRPPTDEDEVRALGQIGAMYDAVSAVFVYNMQRNYTNGRSLSAFLHAFSMFADGTAYALSFLGAGLQHFCASPGSLWESRVCPANPG
mmetsp:Transcript_27179/g.68628  ORF Transcript_27179/g.68628 Transcript_27179/m.68628 type:complete len:129 (-) Transcript_27179:464-850(-)